MTVKLQWMTADVRWCLCLSTERECMKKRSELLYTASILAIVLSAYGCSDDSKDPNCLEDGCGQGYTCNSETKKCEKNDCKTQGCPTGSTCNETTGACDPDATFDCRKPESSCGTDEVCNESTGKCDPKPAEDCTTKGCADTSKVCDPNSKTCVDCLTKENCNDGEMCSNHTCIMPECTTHEACVEKHGEGYECRNYACAKVGGAEVVKCGALTISDTSNACEKTGSGNKIVLRGDVLAIDKTYEGGSVVVDTSTGKITYVGCEPDMNDAVVITCPDSVISPGLINAHDHIGYSNQRPDKLVGDERYAHRHDWRVAAKDQYTCHNANSSKNNDAVEMRQLMSGTTAIFGSGKMTGLTRNIDKEEIDKRSPVTYDTFPLGDSGGKMVDSGCSGYKYSDDLTDKNAYGPHVGEGINAAALNEFRCLNGESDGSKNIFTDKLAVIHGVAATPEIMQAMAEAGSSLIWSPRTNVSLYGDTAQTPLYDMLGVNIALGTDWITSGSMNMLRELQCVDFLNEHYYSKHFTDYDMWMMATANGASAFNLNGVIGSLEKGALADIAIFREKDNRKLHRAVIDAQPQDVLLVMLGGTIAFGDENVVASSNCETVDVCGVSKKACPKDTGSKYSFTELRKMTTNAADIKRCNKKFDYCNDMINAKYDLFFCGEPEDEPTCVPFRTRPVDTANLNSTAYSGCSHELDVYDGDYCDANDIDGDGIPNKVDNCPNIFNPIRPMDNGAQSDIDEDGIGDICDPYPFCATNDASCPVFNAKDRDGDGFENNIDKCPDTPSDTNDDTDGDGFGDACDPCKTEADEDGKGCPLELVSLKSIREAHIAGTLASRYKTEGVVTAIANKFDGTAKTGFFIQSTTNDAGVMVYSSTDAANVKVGDLITIIGETDVYNGLLELKPIDAVTVVSNNNVVTPKVLTADETRANVTESGTKNIYDGMLVTVNNLTVKSEDKSIDKGYYFVCEDASGNEAYLDDYVMGTTPFNAMIEMDKTYTSVTGILVYDYKRSKIAPRSEDDLIAGQGIKAFTSSASTLDWGSDVTMTITLSLPAEEDLDVAIACTNCADGYPTTVTVPEGETTATVTLTLASGLDEGEKATVTATYDGVSRKVEITGMDPAVAAAIASVSPEAVSVKPGASADVTVNMTKAVKTDTNISLATDERFITVPRNVTVVSGSDTATFKIDVAESADVGKTANVTVGSGTEAKTVVVTVKDAASCSEEYTLKFDDQTAGGYEKTMTKEYDNGMTVNAMAQFNDGNYKDAMVMTGNNTKQSYFEVTGLDGVCTITIDYVGYANEGGTLEVIVGDKTETLTIEKSGTAGKQTVEFADSDATSFKVQPTKGSAENYSNRIAINSIIWTTNK